jgi:hypothetical protein
MRPDTQRLCACGCGRAVTPDRASRRRKYATRACSIRVVILGNVKGTRPPKREEVRPW